MAINKRLGAEEEALSAIGREEGTEGVSSCFEATAGDATTEDSSHLLPPTALLSSLRTNPSTTSPTSPSSLPSTLTAQITPSSDPYSPLALNLPNSPTPTPLPPPPFHFHPTKLSRSSSPPTSSRAPPGRARPAASRGCAHELCGCDEGATGRD